MYLSSPHGITNQASITLTYQVSLGIKFINLEFKMRDKSTTQTHIFLFA